MSRSSRSAESRTSKGVRCAGHEAPRNTVGVHIVGGQDSPPLAVTTPISAARERGSSGHRCHISAASSADTSRDDWRSAVAVPRSASIEASSWASRAAAPPAMATPVAPSDATSRTATPDRAARRRRLRRRSTAGALLRGAEPRPGGVHGCFEERRLFGSQESGATAPTTPAPPPAALLDTGRTPASRPPPTVGGHRELLRHPGAFGVLIEPLAEPRPGARDRLVRDDDRVVLRGDEACTGELREHVAAVAVFDERSGSNPSSYRGTVGTP